MDVYAPLIHEFTYQAMINDLLPIEDGTTYKWVVLELTFGRLLTYTSYKFQSAAGVHEDKAATLTDNDNVWTEVRHMHMREAIDKLMGDFNKFLEENAGFKGYALSDSRASLL
jgi:syntaxin-binding protein 1